MPLVVQLRSAVCLLGRFPALAGVDLDVAEGEVVLLSGANGAGKTTLLRLVAGLVPLHSGTATVLGHDLAEDREGARPAIGLVGHETFCYDDLTVRENLRFAAKAVRKPVEAADAALERVGLLAQAGVEHARLSAGQRRRLALAVALAREPRLLLLDEPHAGLDAEGREVLDAVVRAAPPRAAPWCWPRTSSTSAAPSPPARRSSPAAGSSAAESCRRADGLASHPDNCGSDAKTERAEVVRGEPVAGGVAGGGEGPADRDAVAGRALPDPAVRRPRAPAVRVRPRPDRGLLPRVAPGLFWVAVLLAALLAVSRAFAIEQQNDARDGLPLSGLDGSAIFLGKATADRARAARARGGPRASAWSVLYDVEVGSVALLVLAALAATVGLAATGTLYGVLAAGLRVRETLVPVLLLPVVAPVMLGATRAWEAGLGGVPSDAWPWVGLLGLFAVLYTGIGMLAFGPLLEES